jgi:hypothetical protein
MRLTTPSIAFGAVLILTLSGSALLAQDQPAAGAPPPGPASQAPPADAQPPAQAQPPADASQAPPSNARPRPAPNPERQVRTMARRLGLTPDQQSAIEPILADRLQRVEGARSDPALAPRQRREIVQRINRESDRKIESILSVPQRQQYQQMKEENRSRAEAGAP